MAVKKTILENKRLAGAKSLEKKIDAMLKKNHPKGERLTLEIDDLPPDNVQKEISAIYQDAGWKGVTFEYDQREGICWLEVLD